MKIIQTEKFKKLAGSWDDQPNFHMPRYDVEQGSYIYTRRAGPERSEEEIIEEWSPKKKKKRKCKSKKQICSPKKKIKWRKKRMPGDRVQPYNDIEQMPQGSL